MITDDNDNKIQEICSCNSITALMSDRTIFPDVDLIKWSLRGDHY
jgi:hypothetical protein